MNFICSLITILILQRIIFGRLSHLLERVSHPRSRESGHHITPAAFHVRIDRRFGYEAFSATSTHVRPLTAMRSLMYFQRCSLCETPPAILANMRFFPRMHPHVLNQLILFRERFRAHLASERFVPGMDTSMEL